ncbi:MAG: hypothetical protein PHW33_04900 [Candidatus Portnoybacteria bacterium]|nr:hypothetical protein [Candidatus Portnoybacteria bacterium]
MKLKLFGKDIFEFNKNRGSIYFINSENQLKKSKFLPDFHFSSGHPIQFSSDVIQIPDTWSTNPANQGLSSTSIIEKSTEQTKKKQTKITPKKIYEMKMLNDNTLKINTDHEYINIQIKQFKDKLSLIKLSEYDFTRGITEISSIILRLQNRKKYFQHQNFFNKYPYTTTSKLIECIKKHNYLKLDKAEQFLIDLPEEAIHEMKEYEKRTKMLCNKKPIFYILADKKDFEKTEKRKDPILLVQSPFGHIWQILGAWDKEMLLLDEL